MKMEINQKNYLCFLFKVTHKELNVAIFCQLFYMNLYKQYLW